jgi:hypothetical protein
MVFRPANPVTITCEWCGLEKTLKAARSKRDGTFCGRKCSVAWHRQKDAETTWRLMELTRLLWESRPKEFKFQPKEFPGLAQFRVEMNATGKWVREISDAG